MVLQEDLQFNSFVAVMVKHCQRALFLAKVAIVEVPQKALHLAMEVAIAEVLQKALHLTKVATVVVHQITTLAMVEILPSYPFEVVDVAGLL